MREILKFCFLIFLFHCCTSKFDDKRLQLRKIVDCQNKEFLIKDDNDNWLIDFDSIKSTNEFICSKYDKMKDSDNKFSQKNFDSLRLKYGNGNIPFQYTQPQVFPYINIDGIDVSLLQLTYSTATIPFPKTETIAFGKDYSNQFDTIKTVVRNLFEEPTRIIKNNNYRVLTILISNDRFQDSKNIIPVIVANYFEYLENKTKKEICELSNEEIIQLKNEYQLKIKITSYDLVNKPMGQFMKENCN